ncbi:hypothetical protein [Streptomyces sp. KL116D]|uniref:hypothetical protein n=1 Tax=Streptomyces sp. KL116D TaxID=3045152 RepID=UPI003556A5C2
MKDRGGAIVNTGSAAGLGKHPGTVPYYGISRVRVIIQLTREAAVEERPAWSIRTSTR